MPATAEISEPLVRDFITRAMSVVFETMVGCAPSFLAPIEPNGARPDFLSATSEPHVIGTVGFIGDCNGFVHLHLEDAFARTSACRMLGLSEREIDEAGSEVINDAVGELSNMTVGNFKNGLCDVGYPCKLTIPTITRGTNLSIDPMKSARRHTYSFQCGNHRLVADIVIKQEA